MMLKNSIILFLLSISALSCKSQDNNIPLEIYSDGKLKDFSDFIRINNTDSLVDIYMYKYDTLLIMERNFGTDRSLIRGDAFYYNDKKIGKWIIRDYEGKVIGENNFKNGKKHGFQITYNRYKEGLIKVKQFFDNGRLRYELLYDKNGSMIDSITH